MLLFVAVYFVWLAVDHPHHCSSILALRLLHFQLHPNHWNRNSHCWHLHLNCCYLFADQLLLHCHLNYRLNLNVMHLIQTLRMMNGLLSSSLIDWPMLRFHYGLLPYSVRCPALIDGFDVTHCLNLMSLMSHYLRMTMTHPNH